MYSIGEFSKIGSVSTKTLRYYDEIGLLHPANVDEENHYRYYSEEQVDQILYISELKTLDLRLEQIKAIMESKDQSLLEHFLTQRIVQINDQVQKSIQLKEHIERKICEIQSGGRIMEHINEIIVEAKEFQPVCVMSKTATIEIGKVGDVIGSVFEEIFRNGLQPNGPVMTIYLDEEFHSENTNVEVCVPILANKPVEGIKGVKTVDPGLCATCTYTGVYSQIGKAYAAILKWMEANHYQISSSPFDCYMNSPQQVKNSEELITQVWFPIKK